jgi:hypothetical protein
MIPTIRSILQGVSPARALSASEISDELGQGGVPSYSLYLDLLTLINKGIVDKRLISGQVRYFDARYYDAKARP